MKTWDILKATYLISLLHISNENTTYLFEVSRYIKYFETRIKHLRCGIKGVRLISYSSQTRSGTLFFTMDSLMIGNILAKIEKFYRPNFFSGGMTLNTFGTLPVRKLTLSSPASLSVCKFSLHYPHKTSYLVMRIKQIIIDSYLSKVKKIPLTSFQGNYKDRLG